MSTAFYRIAFLLSTLVNPGQQASPEPLLTIAEKSDYKATSRHADVVAFCERLAKEAPLVRLGELGTSSEGRKLPLVILADPPIGTPEEAAKSGKLVVFAIGNIHAGEVDGKEALLMLVRDLATAKEKPLLKDLVIVFAPIFNADGNERIDKKHRTDQNGPADGVGIRENAQGFDLNRDFVKLESPEVRALVRFHNKWNPALMVDMHTTNGSYHRYTLTYDGPRHPAADAPLIETVRDKLLPDVGKRLELRTGYKSFFYGDFSPDHKKWLTYGAQPRFGLQYVAMRHRIAILSESYTYASFKDRVLAGRAFALGLFEYAAEHKDEIRKLEADPKTPDKIPLRTKTVARDKPYTALGWIEDEKDGKHVASDKPKDYEVQLFDRVEPTLSVTRPYAYLFPSSYAKAVETLQRHGIAFEELREDIELDLEVYRVDKIEKAKQPFQKHTLEMLEVTARPEARRLPAGTILVKTAQPLGALAAFILEPQSDDGLATWNFFDEGLAEGKDYPVVRLASSTPLTSGPVRPLAEERKLNKPISEDMFYGKEPMPNLQGNPVGGLTWLEDGEHFLQIKDNQLRKVQARSGRSELFVDSAKLAQSLKALPTLDPETVQNYAQGPHYNMNPQRTGALYTIGNDLYFAHFDGSSAVRLTKSPGAKEYPSFSPDGKYVGYVRADNLCVVDVGTQAERALTTDGGGEIRNGKADWVYWEEIFNRHGKAFWWSPDSKWIAFMRFDDTPVHKFTVLDHLPIRQKVETTPYPKAGDPNPLVTLGIVSAAGGDPSFADLSDYSPSSSLISRVGWTPDSQHVLFYMQNRAQTWLDVCTCSPHGGKVDRLFRETTKAWVYVEDVGEPTFLKDGSFLLLSERTGWRHLYHFDKAGKLLNQITTGEWEVRRLHVVDEKNGWIYLEGTKDSPTAENLYRCKLDGSSLQRLTTAAGSHQTQVSPTGSLFNDSYSDLSRPIQVHLCQTDGSPVRVLDTNPVYAREEYRLSKVEPLKIPMADGFILEGILIKPPDFDAKKHYPVWFQTYAGPHFPSISDTWGGGRLYDQVLASLGFVVFHCDPRSASGKGAVSAWTAYKQLGVQELKDIEEAIDWLCKNPWIDPQRIGMSGASYGGFMTSYAMTHSTKFAAGIAGASVTDWRNYDSIYTERYMQVPQENPEGYEKTSVVKAAKNLHGKLLLMHGIMDDNVHLQNTVQLMEELQRADKDFEVMFYPHARHGYGGKFVQRKTLEFIKRTLADKNQPPPTSSSGE